jgi:Transposase DDE domain group 1
MRTLAMPKTAEPWSLTGLREKLVKIGAKVVSHGRYVTFQLADVAVLRQMFADILLLIARLRAPPAPALERRARCQQRRQRCAPCR